MIDVADTYTDSSGLDLRLPRYMPHRRGRTSAAALRALAVANRIRTGRGSGAEPDEHALFAAMQVCAYRAARNAGTASRERNRQVQWIQHWLSIREHIVNRNLGLAHWAAKRFSAQAIDEDELLSEALFALARAVEGYNPWSGFRFSTYAVNAILRSLVRRVRREHYYRRVLQVHLDMARDSFMEDPLLGDYRVSGSDLRLHEALATNRAGLSSIEALVLAHRFPMDNRPSLTLQQVSDIVGLSKERIRQIQKAALCKLRSVLVYGDVET